MICTMFKRIFFSQLLLKKMFKLRQIERLYWSHPTASLLGWGLCSDRATAKIFPFRSLSGLNLLRCLGSLSCCIIQPLIDVRFHLCQKFLLSVCHSIWLYLFNSGLFFWCLALSTYNTGGVMLNCAFFAPYFRVFFLNNSTFVLSNHTST